MADNKTIITEKVVVDTQFNVKSAANFAKEMVKIAERSERTVSAVKELSKASTWTGAITQSKRLASHLRDAREYASSIKSSLAGVNIGAMGGGVRRGYGTNRAAGRFARSFMAGFGITPRMLPPHVSIPPSAMHNPSFARMPPGFVSSIMQRRMATMMSPSFANFPRRGPLLLNRAPAEMDRTREAAFSRAKQVYGRVIESSPYTARQIAIGKRDQAMASLHGRQRYAGGFRTGTITPPAAAPSLFQSFMGGARGTLNKAGPYAAGQFPVMGDILSGRINLPNIPRFRMPSFRMPSFKRRRQKSSSPERMIYDFSGIGPSGKFAEAAIGIPTGAKGALDAGIKGLRSKYGGGAAPMGEVRDVVKKIVSAFETGGTKSSKKIREGMIAAGAKIKGFLGGLVSKVGGGTLRGLGLGGGPIGMISGLMKMPFKLLGSIKHAMMAPFRAITRIRHMFWNLAFLGGMGATAGFAAVKGMRPAGKREMWQKQFAVIMGEGNTPMEKYASGQGVAKNRIGWLTEAAERLPATIEQTVEAGRLMTVFGMFNKKNFETAGDAALAYNKSLERVAETLGRLKMGAFGLAMRSLRTLGISRGKLEGEGITFKGASPEQSSGAIVKAVMNIWQREVGGLSRNIADSFDVSLSNVGDAFRNMMAKITENLLTGWKTAFNSLQDTFKYIGNNVSIPGSVGAKIGGLGVGASNLISGVATPEGRKRLKGDLAALAKSSRKNRLGFNMAFDPGELSIKKRGGTVTDDDLELWDRSAWASAMEILKNTLNNAFVTGTALLGGEIAKLPSYMIIGADYFFEGLSRTGEWITELMYQTGAAMRQNFNSMGADFLADLDLPGTDKVARKMKAKSLANIATADTSKLSPEQKELSAELNRKWLSETTIHGPQFATHLFGKDRVRELEKKGTLAATLSDRKKAMELFILTKLEEDKGFADKYGTADTGGWLRNITRPLSYYTERGKEGSLYERRKAAAIENLRTGNQRQRSILGLAGESYGYFGEALETTGGPQASMFLEGKEERFNKAQEDARVLASRAGERARKAAEGRWESSWYKMRGWDGSSSDLTEGEKKDRTRAGNIAARKAGLGVLGKEYQKFKKQEAFEKFVTLSPKEAVTKKIRDQADIYGRKKASFKEGEKAKKAAMEQWNMSWYKMRGLDVSDASGGEIDQFLTEREKRDRERYGNAAYHKARKAALRNKSVPVDPEARKKYIEHMTKKAEEVREKYKEKEIAEAPIVRTDGKEDLVKIAASAEETKDKLGVMLTKLDNVITGLSGLTESLVGLEGTV